jgi:hypothetical protein
VLCFGTKPYGVAVAYLLHVKPPEVDKKGYDPLQAPHEGAIQTLFGTGCARRDQRTKGYIAGPILIRPFPVIRHLHSTRSGESVLLKVTYSYQNGAMKVSVIDNKDAALFLQ